MTPKTVLHDKLKSYGLNRGKQLAPALKVSRSYVSRLFHGKPFGVSTAKKISIALKKKGFDVPWWTVFSWQKGNGR